MMAVEAQPTPVVRVRSMRADDIDSVLEMGERFYAATGLAPGAPFDSDAIRAFLESAAAGNLAHTFLLAFVDAELAGMIGMSIYSPFFSPKSFVATETAWWVEPKHRDLGVGTSLVMAAEIWAQESGAKSIFLTAMRSMAGEAIAKICERRGYKPLEQIWARGF